MMDSQQWLPFADSGTHFDTLHGQHPHRVAVCTTSEGKQWQEQVYDHDTARSMAGNLAVDLETYISQSGLERRRRVPDVASLNAHWVDLDIYNTPYANKSAHKMLALVQEQHAWLPAPTMIVSSGRGFHFEWVFIKPVAADSLPLWQVTQDTLTDLLKPLGADPSVRDAARVLRLVGSRNDKNGALVVAQIDTGGGVDFKKFAKLVQRNQPAPIQTTAKPSQRTYSTQETAGRAKLNGYKLAQARMSDCVTLAELRGAPLQDCRSRLLYVYACAGAWFWASREHAAHELNQFSRDYFAEHETYGAKRCQTILERMGQAKSGVIQLWQGRGVDPRYRLRNANIIRELEITPDEQTRMQTLICKSEKSRRRRIRDGAVPWNEHIANRQKAAQERAQEAVRLKTEGYKQVEIARLMGVSQQTVSRLLSKA